MIFNFKKNQLSKALIVAGLALTSVACSDDDDDDKNTPDTNVAPVITSTAQTTVESMSMYSYVITATDADGDTVTYSASTSPAWLSFDTSSGELSGTPADADIGDHSVTLVVSDGTDMVNQSFTVSVTAIPTENASPVITSAQVTNATVDSEYQYTFIATDVDTDDVLTMSATAIPSWLTFSESTGLLSGTPASTDLGDHTVTLSVNDGTVDVEQTFTITVADVVIVTPALVIFDETESMQWLAWDSDGGSTPALVSDDAEYGNVTEFVINGNTVVGFSTRDVHGASGGTPFDASAFSDTGIISFDLKMTALPTAGETGWKFKMESTDGATPVEIDLSTSVEAHAVPVLDTWQHYTFNLADLKAAGLDTSAIDIIMIFPAWGSGDGAMFRVDNVKIFETGAKVVVQPELPLDFEDASIDYPLTDFGGNVSELVADPDAANTRGTVVKTVKASDAATWAGTTTSSDKGLAEAVPLTADNSIMKLWVYSPEVGLPIRLKMEDSTDVTLTIESEAFTTVADTWEELSFDMSMPAAGTNPFNSATNFDKASVFFNFGVEGVEQTFYWDNLYFDADADSVDPVDPVDPVDGKLSLPLDFDDDSIDYASELLTDFGGAITEVTADPTDSTNMVSKTTKPVGAETWAGTTFTGANGLETPISASNIAVKVWVYSPEIGIPVMLKTEDSTNGDIFAEQTVSTTVANAWEELVFDYTTPSNGGLSDANTFDKTSIFFDFPNAGTDKVFYWDNVDFTGASTPVTPVTPVTGDVTLPLDFENSSLDYIADLLIDFGDMVSTIVSDPDAAGSRGMVAQFSKPLGAASWAGTTFTGANGLVTPITSANTTITAWVYSPDVGTNVLLKVEDNTDTTKSVETLAVTTVSNTWEKLTFDFTNEADGTAAFNDTYTYDKASIFLDFSVDGSGKVFYWDNVEY